MTIYPVHAEYSLGGVLRASIAAGAISDQFGNPGAAFQKIHRRGSGRTISDRGDLHEDSRSCDRAVYLAQGSRRQPDEHRVPSVQSAQRQPNGQMGNSRLHATDKPRHQKLPPRRALGRQGPLSSNADFRSPARSAVSCSTSPWPGSHTIVNDDFSVSAPRHGSVAATAQKVMKSIGGVISIAFQQGDPYSGLEDPPGCRRAASSATRSAPRTCSTTASLARTTRPSPE